jgi:hypothetical protein
MSQTGREKHFSKEAHIFMSADQKDTMEAKMLLRKIEFRALAARVLVAFFLALAFGSLPMVAKGQDDEGGAEQRADRITPRERCLNRAIVEKCVKVYVNVLDSDTAKDVFGRRIGDRFIVIQVTITNRSDDFQFLIHDVSLDLRDIYLNPSRELKNELSSLELSLMRGVAERGMSQDRRNLSLRILRGLGTLAAGLIGVGFGGNSYPEGIAVFNGPLISAFVDVFPDYTINQMNRLSDTAYRSNTLVPKQQSRVIVGFIPQKMIMDKRQRSKFKSDPLDLATYPDHPDRALDLRKIEAVVDGNYVTEIGNLPLTAVAVIIDPAEMKKFQTNRPEVIGYISGQALSEANIRLLNQDPDITIEKVEDLSTETKLYFKITSSKPLPPGTPLSFQVSREGTAQALSTTVSFQPDAPTLTGITPAQGERGETDLIVTLTGTNFIPNTALNQSATTVLTESGVHVVSVESNSKSSTSLDVTLRIEDEAPLGPSEIRVLNANGQSNAVLFTVTPRPAVP